jgi:cysteine synthase A
MRAAVERAKRLAQDEGAFYGGQLEGAAAEPSLAEEVAAQLGGEPDAVVACVGSGATFLGLRARFPRARAVAVVSGPPVAGAFAEDAEALRVAPADARAMRARLAREEGILAGLSSGAAAVGAVEVARELGAGRRVVTVFADTGERYFSLEAR